MRSRFPLTVPLDARLFAGLVEAFARHNLRLGALPPLLASGVRYDLKGAGRKDWRDASEVLATGLGDCKDLTAYALAELWRGPDPGARAEVAGASLLRRNRRRRAGGPRPMVHAYVRLSDGSLWDPSVTLGMPPPPPEFYAMPDDDFTHELADLDSNRQDTGKELAGVVDAESTMVGGVDADHDGTDDAALYDDADLAQLGAVVNGAQALGDDVPPAELVDDAPPARPFAALAKLRWDVRGKHAAMVVPLRDGRTMTVRATAATGKRAFASAASALLEKAAESPVVASLLPPGAVAVATAVTTLARMRPKDVAKRAERALTSAGRALAAVFS